MSGSELLLRCSSLAGLFPKDMVDQFLRVLGLSFEISKICAFINFLFFFCKLYQPATNTV